MSSASPPPPPPPPPTATPSMIAPAGSPLSSSSSSAALINGFCCGEMSPGPSSLTQDTSSQGSPAEDPSSNGGMTVDGGGPTSPLDGLDHDSLEAPTIPSESANGNVTYGGPGVSASPPFCLNGIPTPLQRSPSVAPMEVDCNSNSTFDPMDVSDIARHLPQVSGLVTGSVVTSLTSPTQDINYVCSNGVVTNEEALRKKIEELQRELQR